MMTKNVRRFACVALVAAVCCGVAGAQEFFTSTQPMTPDAAMAAPAAAPHVAPGAGFWPRLGWSNICWFAAVVILALTLRGKPVVWVRNLDALVLAGTCLLLGLRDAGGDTAGAAWQHQSWAYIGLTAAAVYWLLRGVGLLLIRAPMRNAGAVSGVVRGVLVLAGLAICAHQLATAPLSSGSRDGIVGGLFTVEQCKLPYGDAPGFDQRSPLLYVLHAGAARLAEPTIMEAETGLPVAMTWANRASWLAEPWEESTGLIATRLANAALFILMLLGLCLLGRRLQGADGSWTMVAIFCVFPGALECLPRPEIMLPAVLMTWALALALLPGIGGLLGMLCLVLAGTAWPWAWLGLPIMLAWFWRKGTGHVLGSSIGLIGGVALVLLGISALVQPSLPRPRGALAMAGYQALYGARLEHDDLIVLDRRDVESEEIDTRVVSTYAWRTLVKSESVALQRGAAAGIRVDWPNGINGREVLYRQIEPTDQARPVLQAGYRTAVAELSACPRLLAATRTVLEETWRPATYEAPPLEGAWRRWGGPPPVEGAWLLGRRAVKAVLALLVVCTALVVFFGRRTQPRHLLGALLLTTSGALIASELGAVTYLVGLVPLIGALWVVNEPPAAPRGLPREVPRQAPSSPPATAAPPGPTPRITVESEAPPQPEN